MKLSDITVKNVLAFIEGNSKMWYCIKIGHKNKGPGTCRECGCSIPGKWFVEKSCNNGKRFPDLMDKFKWDEFKKKNNI